MLKKNLFYVMAILAVAVFSVSFISCSKDDDKDDSGSSEGGSSASSAMTVDGKTYAVPYAFYIGDHSLMFSSLNMKSSKVTPNDKWLGVEVDFDGVKGANDIAVGEHTDVGVEVFSNHSDGSYPEFGAMAKATVAKKGSGYVIDIQVTNMTDPEKGVTSSSKVTLHYEGSVVDATDMMKDK